MYGVFQQSEASRIIVLERFSIGCRKPKTKLLTSINHKKRKQHKGPIKIRI